MASIVSEPRRTSARIAVAVTPLGRTPLALAAGVAIGAAWLVALAAEVSGRAIALHHHTLIEGGPPLWLALPLFLVAWQVMVAAMMLPASLPAVAALDAEAARFGRPGLALASFLLAYAAVWSGYGAGAFLFDAGLHRFADAVPWLGARPWLIEAAALVAAGLYQFVPLKRHGLQACRHPSLASAGPPLTARDTVVAAGRFGLRHAVDCVVSSWALMLLMFAAGFANLWWMAALGAVMAYETLGRRGRSAASMVGVGLLTLAAFVLATGTIPAFIAS